MQVHLNGQSESIEEAESLADLLARLNLADAPIAVEVNMELIPREDHAQHILRDGDELEVVKFVGGG
ncbi:MAG: sulfur carrier protein ThiS [Pirellulaceae bacterium]|nr:sulfur carrier protein ThiS [Pirellulaceae bacterium]MDP7020489.1 sulfur carrier protein ThiS [Pirellulaceae bacterium]